MATKSGGSHQERFTLVVGGEIAVQALEELQEKDALKEGLR